VKVGAVVDTGKTSHRDHDSPPQSKRARQRGFRLSDSENSIPHWGTNLTEIPNFIFPAASGDYKQLLHFAILTRNSHVATSGSVLGNGRQFECRIAAPRLPHRLQFGSEIDCTWTNSS
jgi:hypothetical protein